MSIFMKIDTSFEIKIPIYWLNKTIEDDQHSQYTNALSTNLRTWRNSNQVWKVDLNSLKILNKSGSTEQNFKVSKWNLLAKTLDYERSKTVLK